MEATRVALIIFLERIFGAAPVAKGLNYVARQQGHLRRKGRNVSFLVSTRQSATIALRTMDWGGEGRVREI